MNTLTESALRQKIAGGETSAVEFKVAAPRPTELAERLCGMANAQGGIIIIGVEDATLSIIGIPTPRMAITRDVVLRAARQIDPALVLTPPEPEVYTLDDKQLVVATVPPNQGPIYQVSGVCWIRRGTHTIPLGVPEMLELAYDRGLQDWELQPARYATMEDIDLDRVKAYLSQRATRKRHQNRLDDVKHVLIGMECAKVTGTGEVVPTNAGLLFFGHDPQLRIIQSEVVCVLYHDTLGVGGYADRRIITGTTQELIDETEAFLTQHIPVGAKIEGWKRIDLPDYPIEALREAVVNAVIHRDYSRRGESIRVFYYADRVEIHSPGLLLPGITIEQMERGDVTSKLRNTVLANLLRDIPGYMERVGSGIRLMLNETKRMGLPAPQFREQSEFRVTFYKAPTPPKDSPRSRIVTKERTLWDEDPAFAPLPEEETPQEQEQDRRVAQAMLYIQEHGAITNAKYRELTGTSDSTARRDLERLVEKKILRVVGKTRGRQYRLY